MDGAPDCRRCATFDVLNFPRAGKAVDMRADAAALEPLARAIADSGIPSETSEELEQALWAKYSFLC